MSTRRPGASGRGIPARRPGAPRPGTRGAARPGAATPATSSARTASRPPQRQTEMVEQQQLPGSSTLARVAILASIVVLLVIMLQPTVRLLFSQRSEIAELQSTIASQRERIGSLETSLQKWKDPAYVEQQARQRLGFVKVGDKTFSIVDSRPATGPGGPAAIPGAVVAAPDATADAPWYSTVWQSVRLADRPTSGMLPPKQ